MVQVKVANIKHVSAIPYQGLADIDFVKYEENLAYENARKLHEGEVDLALIPAAEFAVHGGYVGLEFGIGYKDRADTLRFCSKVPFDMVETVNVLNTSSSSTILLRILLNKVWSKSPKIIRREDRDLIPFIHDTEAALINAEHPKHNFDQFPYSFDIVEKWVEVTGMPYVPFVWAMRPNALHGEQQQFINETLHRLVRARVSLAKMYAEQHGLDPIDYMELIGSLRAYYVDSTMMEGLDQFLSLASSLNIIPAIKYRSATLTLFKRQAKPARAERSIERIMNGALDNERVAIEEGIRLAYQCSVSQLGLIANALRLRRFPCRRIKLVHKIESLENISRKISDIVQSGINHIILPEMPADLDGWVNNLNLIREKFNGTIEGGSVTKFKSLSIDHRITMEKVLSVLSSAGLSLVPGYEGRFLIGENWNELKDPLVTKADWLSAMKWIYKSGAKVRGLIRFSGNDTWEERLLHLHKLRAIQDEIPAFESIALSDATDGGVSSSEERLRSIMVARIFLDNFESIEEPINSIGNNTLHKILSICSGADSIRLYDDVEGFKFIEMFHVMIRMGMDIEFSNKNHLNFVAGQDYIESPLAKSIL